VRVLCAGALAVRYQALGGDVRSLGKPDPAIYQPVLAQLDLPKDRVLAVGDSLRTDIAGAIFGRAAGMLGAGRIAWRRAAPCRRKFRSGRGRGGGARGGTGAGRRDGAVRMVSRPYTSRYCNRKGVAGSALGHRAPVLTPPWTEASFVKGLDATVVSPAANSENAHDAWLFEGRIKPLKRHF